MVISEDTRAAIDREIAKYPQRRGALLPALHLVQEQHGHVSADCMRELAEIFEILPIEVMEVVQFYNMFHDRPQGRHQVHVCTNLPCSLRGARGLMRQLESHLDRTYDTKDEVRRGAGPSLDSIVYPLRLEADELPSLTVGRAQTCDIVIDELRGPLLLELNARPGLSIQLANDAGLVPRLRHIENLESFAHNVEDRVDYAMETFTRARRTEQTKLWEGQ